MNNVQFEEESTGSANMPTFRTKISNSPSGVLMKLKLARTSAQANIILLCVIIASLVIVFYEVHKTFAPPAQVSPREFQKIKDNSPVYQKFKSSLDEEKAKEQK